MIRISSSHHFSLYLRCYNPAVRWKKAYWFIGILMVIGILVAIGYSYSKPAIQDRISWRLDFAFTYLRNLVNPVDPLSIQGNPSSSSNASAPSQLEGDAVAGQIAGKDADSKETLPLETRDTQLQTASNQDGGGIKLLEATPTLTPTPLPSPTPEPLPEAISLPVPSWEKQDINNCGPASLAMYLRYWGWEGDQFEISDLLKPNRRDRNVNVEELVYYVRTRAGWLNAEYRVGGELELLKRFLATGIPVMVEEGVFLEETYWPGDDHWAAHYLLLTGYDDRTQTFTAQDSFFGADQAVSYSELDASWRIFNRVMVLVYPPGSQETVQQILAEDWDVATNRQNALNRAQEEIDSNPQDAFAWFNLGSNLAYFEKYEEAAAAFDRAFNQEIQENSEALPGTVLPQRMMRYQFAPFIAYFHSGRTEDLLALAEYALKRTPNAEEALLWHGWANYRLGNSSAAIQDFYQALEHNPNYQDARYAIDFVRENP